MLEHALSIRPAQRDDCRLLFAWANDPAARKMSFSPHPIGWSEHRRWFEQRLIDHHCLMYVVLDPAGAPAGQVRLEAAGEREAMVSVLTAPGLRGRGYAPLAIRLAIARARESAPVVAVHAYIKPDNESSVRAFAKAGFGAPEKVLYGQHAALRMSRHWRAGAPGERGARAT